MLEMLHNGLKVYLTDVLYAVLFVYLRSRMRTHFQVVNRLFCTCVQHFQLLDANQLQQSKIYVRLMSLRVDFFLMSK